MSRIGRLPVPVSGEVAVSLKDRELSVKGPRGDLSRVINPEMVVEYKDNHLYVQRPSDSPRHKSLHGLTRSLIANMVEGVTKGFSKKLVIVGVGYRASLSDGALTLRLGHSHPITVNPPAGISFEVAQNGTQIVVSGCDKELVGQIAANIRAFRPPEPYKGKGVRYENEYVRQKAGKAGKKA